MKCNIFFSMQGRMYTAYQTYYGAPVASVAWLHDYGHTLSGSTYVCACGERGVPAAVDLHGGGEPADVVRRARAW